jgi:hypothetical protein
MLGEECQEREKQTGIRVTAIQPNYVVPNLELVMTNSA